MCQVSVTLLVIAFVIVDAFVMVFILYAMSKRVCKKTNDVFVISFVFLMPLTLSLSLDTLSKRGCRKYNRTNTLKSCLLLVQVHSAIALMTILAMVAHLMMTLWHYGTTWALLSAMISPIITSPSNLTVSLAASAASISSLEMLTIMVMEKAFIMVIRKPDDSTDNHESSITVQLFSLSACRLWLLFLLLLHSLLANFGEIRPLVWVKWLVVVAKRLL